VEITDLLFLITGRTFIVSTTTNTFFNTPSTEMSYVTLSANRTPIIILHVTVSTFSFTSSTSPSTGSRISGVRTYLFQTVTETATHVNISASIRPGVNNVK
jgi:hypothetical protein